MIGKFCLDANILIASWNQIYPENTFPSLWEELAKCQAEIILIKPIYEQIDPMSQDDRNKSDAEKRKKYPLRMWLIENYFEGVSIDNDVEEISLKMEREYEITDTSKGADHNDIKLIAYAKVKQKTVVTFEGEQSNKPAEKSNYKIPLICYEQEVECMKFTDMLKHLGIRI